jgi:hypothetical protein
MSVNELCAELKDVASFIAAREKMAGDPDVKKTVCKNVCDGFVAKLHSCKAFTSNSALQLCTVLAECNLSEDLTMLIQRAIDTRVSSATPQGGGRKGVYHHPQMMTSALVNYLTAAEQAALRSDRTSVQGRMQVIVDRFARLGLFNPHEQTVKWVVAAISLAMGEAATAFPTYASVFAMVHDFKIAMDSAAQPWSFAWIVEYPDSPNDLPTAVFKHAYDDGHPPVPFVWERLRTTANHHVPLRKTSKLLKAVESDSAGPQPPASSSGVVTWDQMRSLIAEMRGQPLQLLGAGSRQRNRFALGDGSEPGSPDTPAGNAGFDALEPAGKRFSRLALPPPPAAELPPTPALALPPPPAEPSGLTPTGVADPRLLMRSTSGADSLALVRSAGHLAVPDAHAAFAIAPGAAAASPPARTAEEYELIAFAAINSRDKKAAAKASAARKRPAAATADDVDDSVEDAGHPCKRPAAATAKSGGKVDLESAVVIVELTAENRKKPRRNFQSKMYHGTFTNAKSMGFAADDCKEAAQLAYQMAGEIYDAE